MQKYNKGDYVKVSKNLGSSMSHFTSDCEAIVIGSYHDQFGGSGGYKSYTLHLKDEGECSWYNEHQLTLIKAGAFDLLQEWKDKKEADRKIKSDMDWIFKNGADVIAHGYSASIISLAECLGFTADSLWGKNGEGINYYTNCMGVLAVAAPFLTANDKDGYLNFCSLHRK